MIKSPLRAIVTLSFGSSLIIGVLALVPMFIAIKPLPFIFYFSIFLLLFINLISHTERKFYPELQQNPGYTD